MESVFGTILREICKEEEILLTEHSFGWIYQLEKNGEIRHIVSRSFDLNPEAAADIMCDKYATYIMLKYNRVPVIEHKILFNPITRKALNNGSVIEEASTYFAANKEQLVVKSNDGKQGKEVFLCFSKKELEYRVLSLFARHNSISLCPFYTISKEYRIFMLKDQVLFLYGKEKPYIIGDGYSSIEEIAMREGKDFLQLVNRNATDIPALNEKVEISWKHNLSGGASPIKVNDNTKIAMLTDLARAASKAINIGFATVDVAETESGEFYVMEINSGVAVTKLTENVPNGFEIGKEIYRAAVRAMFFSC